MKKCGGALLSVGVLLLLAGVVSFGVGVYTMVSCKHQFHVSLGVFTGSLLIVCALTTMAGAAPCPAALLSAAAFFDAFVGVIGSLLGAASGAIGLFCELEGREKANYTNGACYLVASAVNCKQDNWTGERATLGEAEWDAYKTQAVVSHGVYTAASLLGLLLCCLSACLACAARSRRLKAQLAEKSKRRSVSLQKKSKSTSRRSRRSGSAVAQAPPAVLAVSGDDETPSVGQAQISRGGVNIQNTNAVNVETNVGGGGGAAESSEGSAEKESRTPSQQSSVSRSRSPSKSRSSSRRTASRSKSRSPRRSTSSKSVTPSSYSRSSSRSKTPSTSSSSRRSASDRLSR